jgi:ATP-binding cassette subfamily B protein
MFINILRRILAMLKPYRGKLALGYIMLLIFLSLILVAPMLTRIIVDDVISAGEFGTEQQKILYTLLALMVVFAIGRAVFAYFRLLIFEKISQDIIYDLRTGLYKHLSSLPFRFYDTHQIGEIMSRMTGDIEAIRMFIAGGLMQIFEQSLFYIGSLIFVFFLSYKIALILLAITPLLAFIGYKFDKNMRPAFNNIREQNAVLNTRTQENIAGTRLVKAYNRQDHERKLFDDENYKQRDFGIAIAKIFSNFHPIIEIIASSTPAILLLIGGYFAVQGTVSTGSIVAIFGYLWMITNPTRQLANILNMITQTISSGEKLFYYSDFGSYIKNPANPKVPEKAKGHVVFDDVYFSYGDETVLSGISFDVEEGKTLAIMGATGSGKTSIINLLGRFYECYKGEVKVDGINVKEYDLKFLRKQIGYVNQETFLYSDSLAGNIAFGNMDADMEDVYEAAEIAQATEFIAEKDEGYDLIVGERGTGLSGGQKQRTAIARALLINPKILVLDDATASVDTETEQKIQQGLKSRKNKSTTIIISHRISAVQDADEIIVLDHGKIAERGKHAELLEQQGIYHEMFMEQYQDYMKVSKEVG